MQDRIPSSLLHRLILWTRLERFDAPPSSLFEFRRLGVIPAWTQLLVVVGLFVVAVFLTHAEYVERGTCFGFAGPAFNMLFNPIYEELIFRGWILGQLARYRSNLVAVVVSSLLFGTVHVRNIYWMDTDALIKMMASAGLVTGPLFAYLTLRLRSLWPSVILHYLNNLAYYLRN
jgi:membrane protease YdiL (CAAX protease family)